MNSKENRARIFQIEELLLFLLITETNLEKYNQHPLGKIPRNIQLIEQFKENNPNIVPIEWDHDKMLQFYYDQVEFKEPKGPVQISSNATWIEKDFRFRVEERERPRKRELFLFFILGMAFYFWTGWQEKKSSTKKQGKSKKGSPGKGKKGDGKKGPPGKGREGGTRGY
ncbi:hypothetical protein PHJA_002171200 [Phtheirospermum japonicum]|uniref:Uncharacterized protein n=1 Tax=Phtheirospermum japonicum TaxID=374723 RepID=A0A830D1N0_9LAMI|nr:hypothetical protein PHJA_002171200 [Phtheirospermum japonicum]